MIGFVIGLFVGTACGWVLGALMAAVACEEDPVVIVVEREPIATDRWSVN